MKAVAKFLIILFFIMIIFNTSFSQMQFMEKFISDTLSINMPDDSTLVDFINTYKITDTRKYSGKILGITQTNKYKYFPVDQYITLNNTVADLLAYKLTADSITLQNELVIDNLTLWNDWKPWFSKSRILNGHSYIADENGDPIKEWQWEIRLKKKRKQKTEENISNILSLWIDAQAEVLKQPVIPEFISPYKYRRQLLTWFDFIALSDGFIINSHLTLDFPKDQYDSYILGSGGVYYRKSSYHESIAIGGKDQQWLHRFSPSILGRLNTSLRLGFNSFNRDKFTFIDYWNVFMVNLGFTASAEYHPAYYKGLFCGVGLHLNINGLPYLPGKLNIIEPGLLLTIGFILP